MKISQILFSTEKEVPQEAELISHQLLLRAGFIRKVASGIYAWLPMGLRVLRKIENIVRKEMDAVGATELLMPNILPKTLMNEADRWEVFGGELLRIKDRHERDFCFGPTHEEIITDIARQSIRSYKQLPLNVYQIQTKFRDEIRPRFGLMRAREFVMKDAYSFHLDKHSLNETYERMQAAYTHILNAIGVKFRMVEADAGAIGGSITHEFHVLAEAGEDVLCYTENGIYAANIEKAVARKSMPAKALREVFLQDEMQRIIRLILSKDDAYNALKVVNVLGLEGAIHECVESNLAGRSVIKTVVDLEVRNLPDLQNHVQDDYELADIRLAQVGDLASEGDPLQFARGIEVGHVFQLGQKYSYKMGATVLNNAGKPQPLEMGCYGFGISRMVAAVIEQNYDAQGMIWPEKIAPYQVVLIPINAHKDALVKKVTEDLYAQLLAKRIEVLYDNRQERPGVMFADADLIGIPHKVVISAKHLLDDDPRFEYKSRQEGVAQLLSLDALLAKL